MLDEVGGAGVEGGKEQNVSVNVYTCNKVIGRCKRKMHPETVT